MGSAHAELVWLLLQDKISPEDVLFLGISRAIMMLKTGFSGRKDYSGTEEIGIGANTSRWINAVSVDASSIKKFN